jgi:hypothetical protein
MKFPVMLWDLFRSSPAPPPQPKKPSAQQERYDALVHDMKRTWTIRVRKWRSHTSGCAWELRDRSGAVTRMIESPYPRGPISCVIFLHEVGHHATGFNLGGPRCLEEHRAWEWALREMQARGFNVTERVRRRRDAAMRYALRKALRRGLKRVPQELVRWLPEGVELAAQA